MCRVGFCPVGCGRPGPVFGPVVQYFLACGGGIVNNCSLNVVGAYRCKIVSAVMPVSNLFKQHNNVQSNLVITSCKG